MEIRQPSDYYGKVKERFPDLSSTEIKKIVDFGLKSFYRHNLIGGDVLLKSRDIIVYSGKVFASNLVFYHYWRIKHKIKLRFKHRSEKPKFNGEYYFGLTQREFEEYCGNFKNKKTNPKLSFKNVYLYKILDECFLDRAKRHFFVYYITQDLGYSHFIKELETKKYKYTHKRNDKNEIEPI